MIKMRNKYQKAYSKYLNKNGIEWQYVPKAFTVGKEKYTPDFYLSETDTYVIIKGYWREDLKKRIELFQKQYFSMNIVVLEPSELKKLRIIK